MRPPKLNLKEIQGEVLIGLQKNAENFIFFKIVDVASFKGLLKGIVLQRSTNSEVVQQQEILIQRHKSLVQRMRIRLTPKNPRFSDDCRFPGSGDPRPVFRGCISDVAMNPCTARHRLGLQPAR